MARLHEDYMTPHEYVQLEGARCPRCFSSDIEGQSWEADGSTASQELSCNSCNASWHDLYNLVGYDGQLQEWLNEDRSWEKEQERKS